jgi:hypothetical protein
MKDEEVKLEEIETSHTPGASGGVTRVFYLLYQKIPDKTRAGGDT